MFYLKSISWTRCALVEHSVLYFYYRPKNSNESWYFREKISSLSLKIRKLEGGDISVYVKYGNISKYCRFGLILKFVVKKRIYMDSSNFPLLYKKSMLFLIVVKLFNFNSIGANGKSWKITLFYRLYSNLYRLGRSLWVFKNW